MVLQILNYHSKGESNMEILNKVREWAGGLANIGVSLAALAIILEV